MPVRPSSSRGRRLRRAAVWLAAVPLAVAALSVPATSAGATTAGPGITARSDSTGSAAATRTLTLKRPVGAVAGDVLVARIANRGAVDATLTASGWTSAGSTRSSTMLRSWVLYRVVGTSEPSSYTFTQDATTSMAGSLSAFGGVDTARPVDDFAGRVNGNSATFSPPAVAGTSGNDVAVWFGTQLSTGPSCAGVTIDAPAGLTESSESCLVAPGEGLAYDVARSQVGAAGAEPAALLAPAVTPTWTGSSAHASTNLTQVLLLRPAARVQVADAYAAGTVDVGSFSVPDDVLHEPSGLAVSKLDPTVAYVHSESADATMVAISTTNAAVLERFTLTNPGQWDWEDIATGPCPAGSCVYVGDIGGARPGETRGNDYAIYRVAEPTVVPGSSARLTTERFRYAYPDGAHNAETLLVDPRTGQVYVVTKEPSGRSGVYTFPNGLPAPSSTTVTTLTKVATLQLPTYTATDASAAQQHKATWYAQATGGAVHPGANRFLIRTPYAVWEYRGADGGTLASAFAATPVKLTAPVGEGQGEAIDYAADGSAYYTLGEEPAPPFTLHRIDRR